MNSEKTITIQPYELEAIGSSGNKCSQCYVWFLVGTSFAFTCSNHRGLANLSIQPQYPALPNLRHKGTISTFLHRYRLFQMSFQSLPFIFKTSGNAKSSRVGAIEPNPLCALELDEEQIAAALQAHCWILTLALTERNRPTNPIWAASRPVYLSRRKFLIFLVDRAYRADLKDIRLFFIKTVLEKKTSLLRKFKIYVSLSILTKGEKPLRVRKALRLQTSSYAEVVWALRASYSFAVSRLTALSGIQLFKGGHSSRQNPLSVLSLSATPLHLEPEGRRNHPPHPPQQSKLIKMPDRGSAFRSVFCVYWENGKAEDQGDAIKAE